MNIVKPHGSARAGWAMAAPAPLEMWGGIECTVNRVGDRYFDQLARNGHCDRPDDIDAFASLGIQAIRYPLLWERVAPRGPASADWAWADERMARLRRSGMRVILGLVHHGSGPGHTSLLDPSFAADLAAYAAAVARRYPWVTDYTPVNEPLTTARFSGLYGFWYPHHRDFASFARALVVQCRAIAMAMSAIRSVNPDARLVQPEDFGRTVSTGRLAYQARYENERRFLSLDLLCGRLTREHPWWRTLRGAGITATELDWFRHQRHPDLLGLNYYLTSDRLLDHRARRYPAAARGGNARDRYADVEAVRAWKGGIVGHADLLRELHARYRLPLAITEVHAGATREDQLRWLDEAWQAALRVRSEGVDVRAVTAWSLLGSWDWHTQVTRDEGHYEAGVFDVRDGRLRPTAVARMVMDLARHGAHGHPVLEGHGWWRRTSRLAYPPVGARAFGGPAAPGPSPRPILISGASGTLGRAMARACQERGLAHRLLSRGDLDVADPASVRAALDEHAPWAVVNAAGYVRVDAAEKEVERCFRENAVGPAVLAAACAERDVRLLTFSSDLVFDGMARQPYVESAAVAPLGVYGSSKVQGEFLVASRLPSALVVRTSAFFGPWDEHNFLAATLQALRAGRPFAAARDMVISPTYVPDLVEACLDLLIDGEEGLWHVANASALSWADFARRGAEAAGVDPSLVEPCETRALGLTAPRPPYSVLASERARLLPPLDASLARWARDRVVLAAAG